MGGDPQVPPPPQAVADRFAVEPAQTEGLLALRALVFDVADEVGAAPVHEGFAWNQPSYTAANPRHSTAIRLASTADGRYFGAFVHCQTTVIRRFRDAFPDDFRYDGNRGVLFEPGEDLQPDRLRLCFEQALTYRRRLSRSR